MKKQIEDAIAAVQRYKSTMSEAEAQLSHTRLAAMGELKVNDTVAGLLAAGLSVEKIESVLEQKLAN